MARNSRDSKEQMLKAVQAQMKAVLADCRAEAEDMILEYAENPPVNTYGEKREIDEVIDYVTGKLLDYWDDLPGISLNRNRRGTRNSDICKEVRGAFDSLSMEGYIYVDSKRDVYLTDAGRSEIE